MEMDDTICYCFHISKRKLFNFMRIHRLRRASQLSECGGAGSGCGWCVPFLKRYFAEEAEQAPRLEDSLTPAEYAQQRGNYIKAGNGTPPSGAILPP